MNKIVCIVGMAGSGKSIAADEFVKFGFKYLRFGQITLDTIKEQKLELNEANERKVREGFRKEHGMAAYAILNIPKIDELLKTSNVIVDGLYSWSEYKVLKEKYGDSMKVVAVFAPPEMRYDRLVDRAVEGDEKQRFRSFTKEEAKARDYAEIENIEKGGPIVMASYMIVNTGTEEDFKKEIRKIIKQI